MKKSIKSYLVIFTLILSIIGISVVGYTKKVQAAAAPPVTQFYIMGYSWSELWNNGEQYYDASESSTVPVLSPKPYIITYQLGYGALLSQESMTNIEEFNITSGSTVVGFVDVTAINNLPTGLNTISLACNSYNSPWNTIRDSITLNLKPSATITSSNSLKTTKTSKLIKELESSQSKSISLEKFNEIVEEGSVN